jgi:predicted aconitase
MQLTEEEQAIRAGEWGKGAADALEMQIKTGEFFGAKRFVPVGNVHMMGTLESMGDAGYAFFEQLVRDGTRARVTFTSNPRCTDPRTASTLEQDAQLVARESELFGMQAKLGAMTVNTCINYQTVYQPHFGEHVAWGDTGTVAYANSVLGARTNYESGPAALAAALTGRTPAYGFHLDEQRIAPIHVRVRAKMRDIADWGALGGAVGRAVMDYWTAPALEFDETPRPSADDLKHLAASAAAHGSLAMFHIVGVTPEAPTLSAALGGRTPQRTIEIGDAEIAAVYALYPPTDDPVELVVFTAPQLSLFEMRRLVELLNGRKVDPHTRMIVTTSEMNRAEGERLGYCEALQRAGAVVVVGTCFYIMYPEKMTEAFGWTRVVTNSAKLANNIGGAKYKSVLLRTEDCIEAAVRGSFR